MQLLNLVSLWFAVLLACTAADSSSSTTTGGGIFNGIGSFFGIGGSTSTSSSQSSATDSASSATTTAPPSSSSSSPSSSSTGGGGIASFFGIGGSTVNPYAPIPTKCPSGDIIRIAEGISDEEKSYIANRQAITNENIIDFLTNRANLTNFDAKLFVENNTKNITIGLAFSGGGYRAMLNGAGQLLGLDSRFEEANDTALGGILQSSTYLVGLSGGNWLVGSIILNDFISVKDIISGEAGIWDLNNLIFNPGGFNVFDTVDYYDNIYDAVNAKENAGFDVTITDVWGRALSDQFFTNATAKGENITFSSIRNLSNFQNFEMPFPIVVADGRTPDSFILNSNSTVFEINPFELGSWDPSLKSFTDTEFLGSFVDNGTNSSQQCYKNFDNAGYVLGTSSSLFNAIVLNLGSSGLPSSLSSIFTKILNKLSYAEVDIASYYPNPFGDSSFGTFSSIPKNDTLYLVDGGEDGQNVPFYPLIQQARDVDLIIAFDNSADTDFNWPNGTSIIDTYQRQFSDQGKGTPFPYVPDVNTLATFTEKPVFFGCNASDMSALVDFHGNPNINVTDIPLVIQMWNQKYTFNSNTSTFKMSYDDATMKSVIQNGFEVSSRGNLTDDSEWAKCVGCAMIRRSQERLGEQQSDECQQCFDRYCWTGSKADAAPQSASVVPDVASSFSSGASSSASSSKKKSGGVQNDLSSRLLGGLVTFMLLFTF